MPGTLIRITNAGRAALVAPGNVGTASRRVAAIGLATAAFPFKEDMKTLPNERKRVTTFGGGTVAPDTLHVVIQDDSTDEYQLFGYGLYLDNGVLFGVYVQSTPILEKSPAAMLLLASDIVFTSIDVAQIQIGPASFLNPPATTERKGVIELATQAEVDASTDDTRALTPKTAAMRYARLNGPTFTGPIVAAFDAGDKSAHVTIRPPAGKLSRASRIRMFGTFGGPSKDTSTHLVTTIRAGFDQGEWGSEYLDIRLNNGRENNDAADAGQQRVLRLKAGGRMLVGTIADDGAHALQVQGAMKASRSVVSCGRDSGGANFRAVAGDYGMMVRNDGKQAALLSTAQGDPFGSYNTFRPFGWDFTSGKVFIDGTGNGTSFGGTVTTKGHLTVGQNVDESRIRLAAVDGYLYANAKSVGYASRAAGGFHYVFADRTFRIAGKVAWHQGNVDPLDKTKGGTLRGHLSLAIGKRLFLAEGSVEHPSLCFSNDGKPDTGLYHSGDGLFGVTCNNRSVLRFTPKLATFDTPVTAPTPTASDRSTRLATTEWVLTAISSASIGQIVFEARKTARAGFLKPNGALLKRNDYPNLWSYAQASGALVSEAEWKKDRWGCFSTGDGKTTFRLPELRGEFIRCWADTRTGIDGTRALGSFQTDQNLTHAHPASCAEVDDHVHAAWTDNQGNHGHHGVTGGAGHHQHIAPYSEINVAPFGAHAQGQLGSHGGLDHDNPGAYTSAAGAHQHEFWTEAGGLHGHNVGIGAGGRHRHGVSVAANGGNEARPRNVALLALIRAY